MTIWGSGCYESRLVPATVYVMGCPLPFFLTAFICPRSEKSQGTCLLLDEQREVMTFSAMQWRALSPLTHSASPCMLGYDIMLTENSVVVLR